MDKVCNEIIDRMKKESFYLSDDLDIDIEVVTLEDAKKIVNEVLNDKYEIDNTYDKAIEIVKQGGVADDVCEWTLDGVYLESPHKPLVSCVTDEDYRYYYCPVCGKKIKIVGD